MRVQFKGTIQGRSLLRSRQAFVWVLFKGTIQGREQIKGGNYSRKYDIREIISRKCQKNSYLQQIKPTKYMYVNTCISTTLYHV